MPSKARDSGGMPNFRRALRFLWPHRKTLVIGLFAALGVSAFYTFSISSVIPLLKVIFAEHETLADWLHRVETERRLGIAVASDMPDDPDGLRVDHVRPDSRSDAMLDDGARLVSLRGERLSAFAFLKAIAEHPDKSMGPVVVRDADGQTRDVTLKLRAYHWWSRTIVSLAAWLPQGKDPESRLRTLAIVMGMLVLAAALGGIFRFANEGLVATSVQRSMHDFRSQLAEHVLRLPLEWHAAQPPGDTLGRFATDLNKVEIGVDTLFGKTVREPLKAAGVIALVLLIDWRLLMVALLGLPIAAIVMNTFGRQVKRAQRRASQSWGRLLDHLGEKLAGIRVVKAYSMEDEESRRFEGEGRTLTRAQTQIELVDAATNPALEALAMLGVAAFVLYGGARVFGHQLEPHLFFAAVVCLGGIFDPVRKLGNVFNRLQQADVSAGRLFDLFDLHPEEPELARRPAPPLPRFSDRIEFRGVSFAYPLKPDRVVLDNVDLTIEHGQVVALVGPNGSGKTTLISLLLRFYPPTSGSICIDGRDIGGVSLESLRDQIGLVTQDAVVFSDTVRNNIAYGAGGVDMDIVETAARLAHIDDFVQTLAVRENGTVLRAYDAPVTARALSGGQRQRIALARAILRDPPILVLDEATSQIDSESERKIQEALEDVTRGRTTIVIAHRFSTIARADVIVVLNEGRIVAHGRHDELMRDSPFYVALCETQFALGG